MTLALHPVAPGDVWTAWSWDPLTLVALIVAGAAYLRGVGALRRSRHAWRRWSRARVACFIGGLVVLAIALISPVHALGETLFAAHMVQHLLLMLVAAPMLALGSPALPLWRALPAGARSASGALRRSPVAVIAAVVGAPLFVGALHAAALWIWHLPSVYDAGLADPTLHALEHVSFLGSAFLLWALVLRGRSRRAPSRGAALALLFATALNSSALGALLTFASRALFEAHRHGAAAWGLGALTDQQLAGLIMWVPAGAFYVVAMGAVFLAWLNEDHDRTRTSVAIGAGK